MRRLILAATAAVLLSSVTSHAAPLPPAAIYTDPPVDKAYPARMEVLHIPTAGGLKINGVAYVAAGPGPHPVAVVLHGLPGNEKNLDLAQTLRRAGFTAVTFNYRGSWGSPGTFSFRGNLDDARAVLAFVRDPANAKLLGADASRIVVMGHSMGGWITSQVAAADPDVKAAILISAADMGVLSKAPLATRLDTARENMESLAGVTPERMAEEMAQLGGAGFAEAAPGLAKKPLLVLTSNDGLAAPAQALVMDVKRRGGRVKVVHVATDHGWSSARIRLETEILTWLASLPK